MLSYQHAYHAGNLADVHKHALLSWVLRYMTQKPKPLSYIETHAGRGVYQLDGAEALKTGEAAAGIARVSEWFAQDHPYADVMAAVRKEHGAQAYPGSPWIASHVLRGEDTLHLAELHPAEHAALTEAVIGAHIHKRDGLELVLAIAPPTPRRGICLIDPSYELKDEYAQVATAVRHLHRKWPVGVVMIWYPILREPAHLEMVAAFRSVAPEGIAHEVQFPPARDGHRMVGSGLFVVNPPYGFDGAAARLAAQFATLA